MLSYCDGGGGSERQWEGESVCEREREYAREREREERGEKRGGGGCVKKKECKGERKKGGEKKWEGCA